MSGPLAGLRVVEFTHMVMGPACGLVLADLGADVIKVEPAPEGDNTRRLGGSGDRVLRDHEPQQALHGRRHEVAGRAWPRPSGCLNTADVLVENFRPGALDKLGLSYEALTGSRIPRLIYCLVQGLPARVRTSTAWRWTRWCR